MDHELFLPRVNPTDFELSPIMTTPIPRNGLLLSATELFVSVDRHDPGEISIFQELSENLLPKTKEGDRRRIASMLSRHPDTPGPVIADLAADTDPLTAYSMLRHARSIPEDILALQAERGPDSLRKAIAARPALSESLIELLARHGSPDVVRVLLDREGLSGNRRLLGAIESRPEILAALGSELAVRGILAPEQLMASFLYLTAEMKDQAVAAAELASLVETAKSPGARPAKQAFKENLLQSLKALAARGSGGSFATDLAFTLGLPRDFVSQMIANDSGEALAISTKALGFSPADTTSILINQLGARLPIDQIRRLTALASTISTGAARLLIQSWITSEPLQITTTEAPHLPVFAETERRKEVRTTDTQRSGDLGDTDRVRAGSGVF